MKPKLLIIISVPRSGTNYFFDKIQKIKSKKVNSYYELFNDSFYGQSQCWDNFYEKYEANTKLEILDKLLHYGCGLQEPLKEDENNHEETISIIKIFPNQLLKKDFIKIIENTNYEVKIMFLLRNIKEVHQSYYHALINNDWTKKRDHQLESYDLGNMLNNEEFRYVYENKIFECYLNDMLNIVKHYKKEYQVHNFKTYKDYENEDFEKMITN